MMLEMIPGINVTGVSPSSADLIPERTLSATDILFLDVHLRNTDSFQLTRSLHQRFPEMKIVILSMFSEPGYETDGKQAGADAVVLKSGVSNILHPLLQELFPGEFSFTGKSLHQARKNT